MYVIARYTLYFLFYSALGGIAETLYRYITEHQLYGVHGFLHLPILPIYGVGALLVIILLGPRIKNPFYLFILAALLASVVEFVAHWLIEVIFGVWIWGYEHNAFNLFGRISLVSSVAFGLVSLLIIYFIHPFIIKVVKKIPKKIMIPVSALVLVVLLTDIVLSVIERLG